MDPRCLSAASRSRPDITTHVLCQLATLARGTALWCASTLAMSSANKLRRLSTLWASPVVSACQFSLVKMQRISSLVSHISSIKFSRVDSIVAIAPVGPPSLRRVWARTSVSECGQERDSFCQEGPAASSLWRMAFNLETRTVHGRIKRHRIHGHVV